MHGTTSRKSNLKPSTEPLTPPTMPGKSSFSGSCRATIPLADISSGSLGWRRSPTYPRILFPSPSNAASSHTINPNQTVSSVHGCILPRRTHVLFIAALAMSIAFTTVSNIAYHLRILSLGGRPLQGSERSLHQGELDGLTFFFGSDRPRRVGRKQRGHSPRVLVLNDSIESIWMMVLPSWSLWNSKKSHMLEEPTVEFSDATQLYPHMPSNDKKYKKGVPPSFFHIYNETNVCVPMAEWQTKSFPTCNIIQEMDIEGLCLRSVDDKDKSIVLETDRGFWRYAWTIPGTPDFVRGNATNSTLVAPDAFALVEAATRTSRKVMLKTMKFRHNFEEEYFESNRVDALAMERLTWSRNVVDAYGYCGLTLVTEYAPESFLDLIKSSNAVQRIVLAREVSAAVAAVHGIDGGEKVSLVHNDINPSNIVVAGGVPKLNDFNVAVLRMWNRKEKRACAFHSLYPNPQWRSPEEQEVNGELSKAPLSEKVDIYALGNIMYKLISGRDVWREYRRAGGGISDEGKVLIAARKRAGVEPPLHPFLQNHTNIAIVAIRNVMGACFRLSDDKRPHAKDIVNYFTDVLESIDRSSPKRQSHSPARKET